MPFGDFYVPHVNWTDSPDIDVDKMLRRCYGEYYRDGVLDAAQLTAGIKRKEHKANELFKSLFHLSHHVDPVRLTALLDCEELQTIKSRFGHKIIAHGVEEAKGGIHNLLLMCISGRVRVPSPFWGEFQDGPPQSSPIPHGPYFVIYRANGSQSEQRPSYPSIRNMEYILVPFVEIKLQIRQMLDRCVQMGLLAQELATEFSAKLVDYSDFLYLLNENLLRGIPENIASLPVSPIKRGREAAGVKRDGDLDTRPRPRRRDAISLYENDPSASPSRERVSPSRPSPVGFFASISARENSLSAANITVHWGSSGASSASEERDIAPKKLIFPPMF